MFTGIVEETGVIKKKILNLDGMELTIHANKVLEDLKVNDSISCSGICLTVTKLFEKGFVVQLVEETIDRTTAKFWDVDSRINLERSLLPSTRLGGHFVQGHIDTITKIKNIKKNEKFTKQNIDCYRPNIGICASNYFNVINRRAKKNIKKFNVIKKEFII